MPEPPGARPFASLQSVEPDAYRRVMQHWPSGVTVVTMPTPAGPHGMTASAFTSVSIAPPLVLIVVDKRWRSHDFIAAARAFAVNILADDQHEIADRFAGRAPELVDRFEGLQTHESAAGNTVLASALAHLDCVHDSSHDAGDHTIFVGRVVGAGVARPESAPLIYVARDYARLASRTH